MINKHFLTLSFILCSCLIVFGQNSLKDLTILNEKTSKAISVIEPTEKQIAVEIIAVSKELTLKAVLWPNPSNEGKVRLSIENLPKEPVFIQIFNGKSELIQEGEINGPKGASLQHTLDLPDGSDTYSIKLSDASQVIKELELEIL